jgi:hypothetical protein
VTTDLALRITSVAGAGLATLGLDPDRLRGLTLQKYFQTSITTPSRSRSIAARSGHLRATRCGSSAGRTRRTSSAARRWPDGRHGVALDVTERASAESELADVRAACAPIEHRTA